MYIFNMNMKCLCSLSRGKDVGERSLITQRGATIRQGANEVLPQQKEGVCVCVGGGGGRFSHAEGVVQQVRGLFHTGASSFSHSEGGRRKRYPPFKGAGAQNSRLSFSAWGYTKSDIVDMLCSYKSVSVVWIPNFPF